MKFSSSAAVRVVTVLGAGRRGGFLAEAAVAAIGEEVGRMENPYGKGTINSSSWFWRGRRRRLPMRTTTRLL